MARPTSRARRRPTARRWARTRSRRRARSLAWSRTPFAVPDDVLTAWRAAGKRGGVEHALVERNGWSAAAGRTSSSRGSTARSATAGCKPYLDKLLADLKPVATRKASEMALEAINAAIPATIGGSADLTGSNNTKTKDHRAADRRQLRRPLHLLRHPRVRHGGGDERHGAARRRDPVWRHLPGLHRLCAAGDPPVGAAEGAGHLCDDP